MKIWLWPCVIGFLSGVGLLSALFYDGWGDWLSWLTLLPSVALPAWFGWLRPLFTRETLPEFGQG
jgi:hypothetical protein